MFFGLACAWRGTRRGRIWGNMQRDSGTTGHGRAILERCLAFTVMCAALIIGGCSHNNNNNNNAATSSVVCSGNLCNFTTIYGIVAMQTSAGTFSSAEIVATPAAAPTNIALPFGWFSFSITGLTPGASVTVSFAIPGGFTLTGYEKCSAASCSALPVAVNGSLLTVVLTDGGTGDADGAANGTITDPSALIANATTGSSSVGAFIGIGVVPSDLSSCTLTSVVSGTVAPISELVNLSFQPSSSTLTANTPFAAVYELETATIPQTISLYGLPLLDSNDSACRSCYWADICSGSRRRL